MVAGARLRFKRAGIAAQIAQPENPFADINPDGAGRCQRQGAEDYMTKPLNFGNWNDARWDVCGMDSP